MQLPQRIIDKVKKEVKPVVNWLKLEFRDVSNLFALFAFGLSVFTFLDSRANQRAADARLEAQKKVDNARYETQRERAARNELREALKQQLDIDMSAASIVQHTPNIAQFVGETRIGATTTLTTRAMEAIKEIPDGGSASDCLQLARCLSLIGENSEAAVFAQRAYDKATTARAKFGASRLLGWCCYATGHVQKGHSTFEQLVSDIDASRAVLYFT